MARKLHYSQTGAGKDKDEPKLYLTVAGSLLTGVRAGLTNVAETAVQV